MLEHLLIDQYNMFTHLIQAGQRRSSMKKVLLALFITLVVSIACANTETIPPATAPSTPAPTVQTPSAGTATPADSASSFNLPEVKVFSVKPFNTVRDYPAVLTWDVKNATDVVIEPNIGAVPGSGSKDFTTSFMTTNFKLKATNAQGSIIAITTLTISGDLPGRDTPVIKEFTARPYVIKKGGSCTLSWKTVAASAVTLDGKTVPAEGSMQVTPGETSEYTLIATSTDGTHYQTIAVNVK
jgi:hypothetical protein